MPKSSLSNHTIKENKTQNLIHKSIVLTPQVLSLTHIKTWVNSSFRCVLAVLLIHPGNVKPKINNVAFFIPCIEHKDPSSGCLSDRPNKKGGIILQNLEGSASFDL